MKSSTTETEDPRTREPKPPFPAQAQEMPGSTSAMSPTPDHGETSYQGQRRLQGKVALITGGDSGIGRAVAIAYAREGADVVLSYLNEDQDAQETAKWIEKAGRKSLLIGGDIAEESHCRSLTERVFQDFGQLDVLVNNAGTQATHETLEEWTTEEWDRIFRTNIYSMFYLCRAALPRMRPGSSAIMTASVQAYQPSPTLLAYAATKGAIVTFTKALAGLMAKQGIRVNAVAPGPVWTPLIPASYKPDKAAEFGKNTLFERPAQPAELAPAYVYLASQESSYVTGSVMDLTGGKMLP
jgi:hypothetical protein